MTKKERFIDVLKTFEQPVTVAEWAKKVADEYPSVLAQINSKTNEKMTLKDLATGIAVKLSKAEFVEVEVENTVPYRRVKYVSEAMKNDSLKNFVKKDIEILTLESKMEQDIAKSTESDRYRLEELKNITDQLNRYFLLNFELHHASALDSGQKEAKHHVDNLQILTTEHTLIKKDAQKKFSIDEQKAYIKRIISVHMMINKDIDMSLTDDVLEMLLDRLEKSY